jgi:dipeptidyl aminopeptidase/acylaminoacyl peptidase
MRFILASIVTILSFPAFVSISHGQSSKHPLQPAEDIGLTLLYQYASGGVPSGGEVIKFSPDKRYFAVVSERGNLQTNKPEDTIWLFNISDIQTFVSHSGRGARIAPTSLVTTSSDKKGPFVQKARWAADSSGIAFTRPMKDARTSFHQLCFVNIRSREMKMLTPAGQDVDEFDVKSESTYVYTVNAPKLLKLPDSGDKPIVQTGKNSVVEALFPSDELLLPALSPFPQAGLWAVKDGKSRQILSGKEKLSGRISLAPDEQYVLCTSTVENPPPEWARYQPDTVDLELFGPQRKVPTPTLTYFLVDLKTGTKKQLFDAPKAIELGWYPSVDFDSAWSPDGKSIVLSNAFLPLNENDTKEMTERQKHPYVAVYRRDTQDISPIVPVVSGARPDRNYLEDAFFQDNQNVVLKFDQRMMNPPLYVGPSVATFRQAPNGTWSKVSQSDDDPRFSELPVKIDEEEDINQPPLIVGTDKVSGNTYTVWDPNPQLKNVVLGDAKVLPLHNVAGFPDGEEIGLVLPPNYAPGRRYPLVIQTHGFTRHQFLTSGVFTTPFAARAIAARDMIVAQVGGVDELGYEEELKSLDSLITKLSDDGLIDARKVGAIGFSSTVRVVMAHMAFGHDRLAAASILDGVDSGYVQSILWDVNDEDRYFMHGTPFDKKGLDHWIAKSPLFNTDKMQTPLLILSLAPWSVLEQWEAYSTLHQQNKPVELITLPAPYEHPSTNPENRYYCETFNADWFDFWLNHHEDPDPAKAEQYKRWGELRRMQEQSEQTSAETTTQGAK